MNRNNEVPLVVADAFVMYYDNTLGKWMASGLSKSVTIAKVQLLHNASSNQFRIFAWNPMNKEVLVNSILYHNLRYQKAHATFHEWRDADTQVVYGLHFADTKDASIFGDVISRVFKSLELIYQQCRELQAQIKATSSSDQYHPSFNNAEPVKSTNHNSLSAEKSGDTGIFGYSSTNSPYTAVIMKGEECHYSDVNKPNLISNSKSSSSNMTEKRNPSLSNTSNTDFNAYIDNDLQSSHNYENINNILLKHSTMKSLPSGAENFELSNKCQSSSDDSIRGLKRQPSSSSSGYATVASITDQYSPTPGVASSFSMVADTLNKCISESKPRNQKSVDYSIGLMPQSESTAAESTSSFASQLQSMIQLRKANQSVACSEALSSPTLHIKNTKSDVTPRKPDGISESISIAKESQPCADQRLGANQKIIPGDDIMSEMKMKLQRRKQLIDGHIDPNYSSSTDKSDVCSSSVSDAGSFVGNMDQSADLKTSKSKNKLGEMSFDNKTLLETKEIYSQFSDDLRSLARKTKMSTGDIQSSSTTILASKHDLDRIKKEIIDDLRKDIMDVKKEVVNAIRLLRTAS